MWLFMIYSTEWWHLTCNSPCLGMVPIRWKEDPKLGKWVSRQRDSHNETFLTPERRDRLDSIGFVWKASKIAALSKPLALQKIKSIKVRQGKAASSISQSTEDKEWWLQFQKLSCYKSKHGHTRVPQSYSTDAQLRLWVQTQCCEQNRLQAVRLAMLQEIGFDFNQPLGGNQAASGTVLQELDDDEKWNDQFFKLVVFRNRHGHTLICRDEERHMAGATYPLLTTVATDKWTNNRVTVSTGPHANKVGSVVKWENNWVSVRIPDVGLIGRRPRELYLQPEKDPALWEWVQAQRVLWNQGCLEGARKRLLQDFGFDFSCESKSDESGGGDAVGNQNSMNLNGADDGKTLPAAPHNQGLKDKAKKGNLFALKSNKKQSPRQLRPALPTQAGLALRTGQNSAAPRTGLPPHYVNAVDAPRSGTTVRAKISVPNNGTSQQPMGVVSPTGTTRRANNVLLADLESGDGAIGALSHSAAAAFTRESVNEEALLARTPPSEQFGMHTMEAIGSNIRRVQTTNASSKLAIPIVNDARSNHLKCKRDISLLHKQDELATLLRKNALHSDNDLSLLMPTDQSKAMMPEFDSLGRARRHPGPGQSLAPQDTASASHHAMASGRLLAVTPSPSQEIQVLRHENEAMVTPQALKTPLPQHNPRINIRKHRGQKRSHAEEEERSFAAACRALVEKQLKRLKSQQ